MSTLTVGTISEKVTDAGVAVDGVTLKDGGATLTSDITATNSSGNLTVGIISGTSNSSIINLGDTDASNVGQVKYHHGVNSMVLRTNSTDKVTLDSTGNMLFNQSGTGIYLGTTSATASNLLDDYEEGSISGLGASVGSTACSGVFEGYYTKVGRLVTAHLYIQVTSLNSGTGDFDVTGLPFTVADLNSQTSIEANGFVGFHASFGASVSDLSVVAKENDTRAEVKGIFASSALSASSQQITHTQIGTGNFRATITYFTT